MTYDPEHPYDSELERLLTGHTIIAAQILRHPSDSGKGSEDQLLVQGVIYLDNGMKIGFSAPNREDPNMPPIRCMYLDD